MATKATTRGNPEDGRNGMKQGYVTRNGFVLLEAVLDPLRVHTHPLLKYPLLNVHYIKLQFDPVNDAPRKLATGASLGEPLAGNPALSLRV
jgi:hypothetical protein